MDASARPGPAASSWHKAGRQSDPVLQRDSRLTYRRSPCRRSGGGSPASASRLAGAEAALSIVPSAARFGRRHWLVGHPVPAEELGSPCGRLTRSQPAGPRRGFHVPHVQDAIGEGPLYSPGTVMLLQADHDHRSAPGASQRRVRTPRRSLHHCAAPLDEPSTRVQAIHRVDQAHCWAWPPSEPDEHLSIRPAQASPEGSRADRSRPQPHSGPCLRLLLIRASGAASPASRARRLRSFPMACCPICAEPPSRLLLGDQANRRSQPRAA